MLVISSIVLALWYSKSSALAVPPTKGATIPLNVPKALVDDDGYVMHQALVRSVAYTSEKYRYRRDADLTIAHNTSQLEKIRPSLYSYTSLYKRAKQGSSLLKSYTDFAWTGMVTLDGQELEVLFDTGSADTVVPGVNCDGCEGHTAFIPKGLSSQDFILEYEDNAVSRGQVWKASVSVGGLTASDVSVGVATYYSSKFNKFNFPADGILALGFSTLSIFKKLTFIDELYNQRKIDRRVFCFKMGAIRLRSSSSTLDLGWINRDLYQGEITYLPVLRQSYWEVNLQSIMLNDDELSLGLTGTGMRAILDTGAHMVSAPRGIVEAIYERLSAKPAPDRFAGMWVVSCKNPPNLSLKFSGRTFPIFPLLFAVARISEDDCIGGLSVGPYDDAVLVGGVFLSNYYSIYDVDRGQVGLASLKSW